MMDMLERNFFADHEIIQDPGPYYAALHEQCGPVWREPHLGVVFLTTIEKIIEVYSDHDTYSAILAPLGPLVKIPQPEAGESWSDVIEKRRGEIPMGNMLTSLDPPVHAQHRALSGKIFTPNRLKENEEFMLTLADGLIDELTGRTEGEFSAFYGKPFTLLVIADLLGVPREDHETFRSWLGGDAGNVGSVDGEHGGDQVFGNLEPYFTRYIEKRRETPSDDVMSQLANARFPNGELPEVGDVVRLATILFAAGQETTARLIMGGMRVLAERPDLAQELRSDPGGIPNFVEELLRLEAPIKATSRFALKDTTIDDVDVPAGTVVMGLVGAANRDPRIFENPDQFDARRQNAKRSIAFGHGEHFCPGASLARTEARISFERLLGRLDDIQLVDPSALSYAETFILRGLNELPLRFRVRA